MFSKEIPEITAENGTCQDGHNGQTGTPSSHESRHREIPLTQGMVAVVDEADYPALSQYRWSYQRNGKRGYAIRGVKGEGGRYTSLLMHRAIMGAQPNELVDHEDGDGLHNWRKNLRVATRKQNAENRKVKGASYHVRTGKWVARITSSGVLHWLGSFDRQDDAVAAYAAARVRLCGQWAGSTA